MLSRFLQRNAPLFGRISFGLALLTMSLSASAQLSITGVADKTVYNDTATFTVVTQAGYRYSATLNTNPVTLGVANTVKRMDYYDLAAWRTNLSTPFDVTNLLVRFIIVASDRGNPEQGLIKWTPYPSIAGTAAEFAGAQMCVIMPRDYPAGLEIPLVAWVGDAQGNERRANGFIRAPGFEASPVKVLRGVGSGYVPAQARPGTINYNAQLQTLAAPKQVNIEAATTWTPVSGMLVGAVVWTNNSRIAVTGHVTVTNGATLTIGAGTVVRLNPLVNITNWGAIVINGTSNQPVVFTSTNHVLPEDSGSAWGGFVMQTNFASLRADYAIFSGAGGANSWNFSPASSHKSQQPVLHVHWGAQVTMTNCAIINTHGQVGNGYQAVMTLDHCLYQKAITSGEYDTCTNIYNHCALIEFPEESGKVDAVIADADYDAIYQIRGTNLYLNTLIGFAKDDCIDAGSDNTGDVLGCVRVDHCWLESTLHECMAWSGHNRKTWAYDTVAMNSGQGIENGWTDYSATYVPETVTPDCYAERLLSTGNSVGARVGDNYNWAYRGFLRCTNSLVLYNYRDVFLKTWNAVGVSWDTNSWVDRRGQIDLPDTLLSTADARFPSNGTWNPAADGWRLKHWMTTPPDAPVGIGLAVWTNRIALADLTNGVPVRLSSFTTNFVSVDYAILGTNGTLASGTVQFAPGETVKTIPAFWPATNDQVLEVALKNPVRGEITSLAQAWVLNLPASTNTNSSPVTLVASNSTWRYLDTGVDAGTAWRALSFNDSAWSNGVTQIGFGDGDERTVVRRTNSGGATIITFYFRKTFVATNLASFTNLTLWLLRDDGGVVYLNGTEVFRSDSMPAGTINYQTLATNLTGGVAPPDNTIDQTNISISTLVTGTNIVAVEIHQQAASSSDISFDFQLVANPVPVVGPPSPPIISRPPTNQTAMLGGTATFSVAATGALPMGYQWLHNQSALFVPTVSPVLMLTNLATADAGSYQVIVFNTDGAATSQVATLTIPNADTDGDGIPDDWELAHGLIVGVNDANLDPDGDGMTNLQEFIAGTDPQDKNSYLKVDAVAPNGGSGYTIQFRAVATKTYSLLYADVVPTNFWAKLQDIVATPTNRVVTVTNSSVSAEPRFYRLATPSLP